MLSIASMVYINLFQALHKESGQVLAIKQVPVDTDLQEIIKEISIMQQCDSPYVVKYYGSYFKNTDLWVSVHSLRVASISTGAFGALRTVQQGLLNLFYIGRFLNYNSTSELKSYA